MDQMNFWFLLDPAGAKQKQVRQRKAVSQSSSAK
jgi:hypothetical protein